MNENDSKITESRPSAGMSIITSFSSEFDPSVRDRRRVVHAVQRSACTPCLLHAAAPATCLACTEQHGTFGCVYYRKRARKVAPSVSSVSSEEER
jgi:hypothetical protein